LQHWPQQPLQQVELHWLLLLPQLVLPEPLEPLALPGRLVQQEPLVQERLAQGLVLDCLERLEQVQQALVPLVRLAQQGLADC
jgi:hypothetical protein